MSSTAISTVQEREPSWHIPLRNPAAHIRLLSFSAEHAKFEEDDEIDCIMLTCVLSKAPQYVAISYTWGPAALTRYITINGLQVAVRENCYYALWQAQHQSCYYIWLDAICVNQDDLEEKSHQVAMMGRIYEKAAHVLVSLGPHVQESSFIVSYLRRYEFLTDGRSEWKSGFAEMEAELGSDHLLRLTSALVWFTSHTYWTRVWIVQEFVVARQLKIRCGKHVLDLETIYDFVMNIPSRRYYHDAAAELGQRLETELASFAQDDTLINSPFATLMKTRHEATAKRKSLFSRHRLDDSPDLDMKAVLDFRGNDCSIPLDHIYGFTHLMRQSKRAITPNYRTSTFELALECLGHVRHDAVAWARRLLGALRISASQPEVRTILDVRRNPSLRSREPVEMEFPASQRTFPWSAGDPGESRGSNAAGDNSKGGHSLHVFDNAHSAPIERTGDGRHTANLTRNRPEFHDVEQFKSAASARASAFAEGWAEYKLLHDDTWKPVELFEDGTLVGLLACQAQVGDYILQSADEVVCGGHAFNVCLLVRPFTGRYSVIIGEGLVSSDWSFCPGGDECNCRMFDRHAANVHQQECYGSDGKAINMFELRLSKEDLVAFAAHDLTGEKLGTRIEHGTVYDLPLTPSDPWAPLERLYTNITTETFSSYAISHSSATYRPVSPSTSERSSSRDRGSSYHSDDSDLCERSGQSDDSEVRSRSRWKSAKAESARKDHQPRSSNMMSPSDSSQSEAEV